MFSNRYIIIYAFIMVLIVAAALTVVAVVLKPKQVYNKQVEKMQNILNSVNISSTKQDAEDVYKKYITETLVVNINGEVIEGVDAFNIDMAKENDKEAGQRNLPVYICHNDKGDKFYIFPLLGKGLWGPIWGFISFKSDLSAVEGAIFDHKGETPGLGSEIDTKKFQHQFIGKSIYDANGAFVYIRVQKGGAPPDDMNAVDAISGGTITSTALQNMIKDCLSLYEKYFEIIKNQSSQ